MAGEQPGNPDESPGGTGGEILADPRHVRADAKLVQRAIRERWPIPESIRPTIVKRLVKIIDDDAWEEDEKPGNRDVIAAVRTLVSADKVNLDQQRLDLIREKQHGTEEGTVKAAQDLIAAREALVTHKAAEKPE